MPYTDREPTNRGTDFYQREPVGAGFTDVGSDDKEFSRGAGDPLTTYTENNDD